MSMPNERLQPNGKGRGETPAANIRFSGRVPSKPLKRNVRQNKRMIDNESREERLVAKIKNSWNHKVLSNSK